MSLKPFTFQKPLLILCFVSFATLSSAQIRSGDMFLSGEVSFNLDKGEAGVRNDAPSTSFTVAPDYGVFLTDNFALGIGLSYSYYEETFSIYQKKENSVGGQLFGTYFIELARSFYFTPKLSVGLSYAEIQHKEQQQIRPRQPDPTLNYTKIRNSIDAGIKPGFSYFLNDKISIDLKWGNIAYAYSQTKSRGETDIDRNLEASFDFNQVFLGMSWYFN